MWKYGIADAVPPRTHDYRYNDTTEVVVELTIIFPWLVYIGEFTGEKGRSHHS